MLNTPSQFPHVGSPAYLRPSAAPVRILRRHPDGTVLIGHTDRDCAGAASGNQTVHLTTLAATPAEAAAPVKPRSKATDAVVRETGDLRNGITATQHAVLDEIDRAVAKFPTWPTDPFHALAVLGEEYGELQKAVLQFTYEGHKGVTLADIRSEAIQTAAMALRWAESLDAYCYNEGVQHVQVAA